MRACASLGISLVEWSKLPDLLAVALLTLAFASVAKRGQWSLSGLWLIGWVMIVLHFLSALFERMPSPLGDFAVFICLSSLTWGGLLFMCASVPYRTRGSSQWILAALLFTNTLYLGLWIIDPIASWALTPAAVSMGVLPLTIALLTLQRFNHPLRWTLVALYGGLSIFLVTFQHRTGTGPALAINAVFLQASLRGQAYLSSRPSRRLTSPVFTSRMKSGTCQNTLSRSA
jgi:hypothetical protein